MYLAERTGRTEKEKMSLTEATECTEREQEEQSVGFIFFRKYLYSNFIMIDNEVFSENIKMTKVTEKAKLLGLHMEKFCWLEDF